MAGQLKKHQGGITVGQTKPGSETFKTTKKGPSSGSKKKVKK